MIESQSMEKIEEFEFTGTARQYFGIWIVNLALSIVTFGIYSAWAKVRTKKYFYQHTTVAGRNFDYHATGKQILIGRIIVIVGLVLYSVLAAIPIVNIVAAIGLLVLIPFLMVRALRFNAQMSSWSNVRFAFFGKPGKAALVYILYPILAVLSLFLTMPFASRAINRFTINNHTLGETPFMYDGKISAFYKAFFAALLWAVSIFVGGLLVMGISLQTFEILIQNPDDPVFSLILGSLYLLFFAAVLPATSIYHAIIRNHLYNNTILGDNHRFHSNVTPMQILFIAFTNMIAIVLTLGLLLPWAKVRMARYMANSTKLLPDGDLDDFVGEIEENTGALGDAYSDIEGLDLGLPI